MVDEVRVHNVRYSYVDNMYYNMVKMVDGRVMYFKSLTSDLVRIPEDAIVMDDDYVKTIYDLTIRTMYADITMKQFH